MASLRKRQSEFVIMVSRLINHARQLDFELTFGQAFRTRRQAEIYAKQKKGIINSKHCRRLAIDFNLFKDGKYLTSTKAHRPLAEYWESIGGTWGGRFKRKDGNHYEYGG